MSVNTVIVTGIYLLAWIPMIGMTVENWSPLPHLTRLSMLGMDLWYPVLWWMFARRKFADLAVAAVTGSSAIKRERGDRFSAA